MRKIAFMEIREIVTQFYTAFAEADAETMVSFYDDHIEFEDPAFGKLKGNDAKTMWKMLLNNSKGNLKVSFSIIEISENTAKVNWEAHYPFSKTGRNIHNKITASLTFANGKISTHKDHFNLWKWTQQAFGFKGFLLGWTPFFKKKIQQQTNQLLKKYTETM